MSLKGRTIAITRPKGQADELAKLISALGGVPRIVPTVEIRPLKNLEPVKEFIERVATGKVDLIIFMSRNGVTSLVKASESLGIKAQLVEALNTAKIVAVGPKTRKELEKEGITVALTPSDHSSSGIIKELADSDLRGKTVAIPRTDKPSDYLRKALEKSCDEILEFPVYESAIPSERSEVLKLIDDLLRGGVDIISFTSSATARNLFQIADESGLLRSLREALNQKIVVVAIGPVTERTLTESGVKVDVMPRKYTIEAMVDALQEYLEKRKVD